MEASASLRNMVEQQIRTWEVLDDRVLDLYYEIARHDFVEPKLAELAYTDTQLPIGHDQVMLEPKLEARILQAATPALTENVLHIGCGSGFFPALLSKLCGSLTTVELIPELAVKAEKLFASHDLINIKVITGDALLGEIEGAPFDLIIATGSVEVVNEKVFSMLNNNGRMLAPIGKKPVCSMQIMHNNAGSLIKKDLFETWIPPLDNANGKNNFEF